MDIARLERAYHLIDAEFIAAGMNAYLVWTHQFRNTGVKLIFRGKLIKVPLVVYPFFEISYESRCEAYPLHA